MIMFDKSLSMNFNDMLTESKFMRMDIPSINSILKEEDVKKTTSAFKKFIDKHYKLNPDAVVNELPTLASFVRKSMLIVPATMLNPLLGLVVYLIDKAIENEVNSKHIDKWIRVVEREKEKNEVKISKAKDGKHKDSLEKLSKELNVALKNLNTAKDKYNSNKDIDNTILTKAVGVEQQDLDESVELFLFEMSLLSNEEKYVLCEDVDLSEGVIKDTANKAKEKVRMGHKVVKQKVNRNEKRVDTWFDKTLKKIKGESRNRTREEIVTDSFPKISKLVKRAIGLGAAYAINPALAGIGMMTTFVISKRAKEFERKKLLSELKRELEIVDEKIKDADGSGEREKKYQLMRVKHKLETDIDRIKRYI